MKRALPLLALAAAAACAPKSPATVTAPVSATATATAAATATVPAPVPLPSISERALPNGAHLMVLADHELPIVTIRVLWDVGAVVDPPDEAGLTDMTVALMRQGTKSRTAAQIAEQIDFVGGDLGGSADDDSAELSLSVLARDFPMGVELLADVARNPSFPQDELDTWKREQSAAIRQELDDPSALASKHATVLYFGESQPHAWFASERSVAKMTRADAEKLRARWLGPEHAIVAVAGDVEPSAALDALSRAFGDWRRGPGEAPPALAKPAFAGRRIRLVDKPDLSQSTIRLELPGLVRTDPDWYPVVLLNAVFGGGAFSSRLTTRVRSQEGKTYGAYSRFSRFRDAGTFVVETSTNAADTNATLALLLDEMTKVTTDAGGVSEEELALAKSEVIGGYPMQFETPTDVLGSVLRGRLDGIGVPEIESYRARIAAVTLDQVHAVAKKYVRPADALIVVVGKASEVKAPLEAKYGPVEVVDYRTSPLAVDRGKGK